MNATSFLSGVLAAWTIGHLGLAVFFLHVFVFGRRAPQYLTFSLLCGAFSILTGGSSYDLASTTIEQRIFADQIVHAGAVLGAAFNVHFAACFVFLERRPKRLLGTVYALAALLLIPVSTGSLWVPGSYSLVASKAFGLVTYHAIGQVTGLGVLFYAVLSLELCLSVGFLVRAAWQRFPGARSSLFGAGCVFLAVTNDLGLALGLWTDTVSLVPHVFVVYAFGALGTLIWHYRATAGELEQTTHRLQQRTEELRHSHAELAIVQSELSTKKQLAAVGELAAAIAHEVRNPLAVIVNAVSGLRRPDIADDDHSMLLGIVDEETARLNRLVTDLLRFARPVSVKRAPVSLVELAKRSRFNVPENYEVLVEAADDPLVTTVYVDPNLFRLVFDNLVSNAFQAMREGGTVEIRIEGAELRGAPASRIQIKDSGHGMEQEVRRRALDPFFTTRPSGTGLGLPIVQRIVEAHGGELSIESEEQAWTRVTVLVPRGSEEGIIGVSRGERVA